jgi:hypothetical protein
MNPMFRFRGLLERDLLAFWRENPLNRSLQSDLARLRVSRQNR